jgi:hypothetical protein
VAARKRPNQNGACAGGQT